MHVTRVDEEETKQKSKGIFEDEGRSCRWVIQKRDEKIVFACLYSKIILTSWVSVRLRVGHLPIYKRKQQNVKNSAHHTN
jgi:hypothetical protein